MFCAVKAGAHSTARRTASLDMEVTGLGYPLGCSAAAKGCGPDWSLTYDPSRDPRACARGQPLRLCVSAALVIREDVVSVLHDRVAPQSTLGVVPLRGKVGCGAGREGAGRRVIVERGPSPPAAVCEPLAVLHHEVDVMLRARHRRGGERLHLFRVPMDLRHLGAVGERLAVPGNAGPVGRDHHGISEDHSHQGSVLTDGDNLPGLVSPELGEREPTRHLQGVLVLGGLGGHGGAAQGTDECRHDSNRPHAFALHHQFLLVKESDATGRYTHRSIMPAVMSRVHYTMASGSLSNATCSVRGSLVSRRRQVTTPSTPTHHARSPYQLPLSPSVSITRLNRPAAFRQLRCTARHAPSALPASICSTIFSCSSTDRAISSTSALVYSRTYRSACGLMASCNASSRNPAPAST